MSQPAKTDWGIIAIAVAAGIAAGFQIGKVPPSLPILRESLGADLVSAGWIISVFNLLAALLGVASGLISDRLGSKRIAAGGILMLALGALSGSFAGSVEELIAARILAGLGLVSIAVSAPRLIVMATELRDRSLALGIWGIYTPAGMALGMLSAPLLLETVGWRGLWRVDAAVLLLFFVLFLMITRNIHKPIKDGVNPPAIHFKDILQVVTHAGPWLLGAIFALYAIQFFAVMSWLPTFLIEALSYSTAGAALLSAIVVACNVIGNLGGAWMLHHGVQRWVLQLTALVIMAICAIGIYPDFIHADWKLPLALLFSASGGMLPAATLAASAAHAPTPGHVATVNGVIVQCTNVGSLSGPPLMAAVVSSYGGWQEAWKMLVICTLIGIACIAVIRQIERSKA
ncbi:MAG: MFS transporter [Chromatiales bacterium]|nr:MFS transporter [Chromatiales bacterium]